MSRNTVTVGDFSLLLKTNKNEQSALSSKTFCNSHLGQMKQHERKTKAETNELKGKEKREAELIKTQELNLETVTVKYLTGQYTF